MTVLGSLPARTVAIGGAPAAVDCEPVKAVAFESQAGCINVGAGCPAVCVTDSIFIVLPGSLLATASWECLVYQPPYRREAPIGGTPFYKKQPGVFLQISLSCERKERSISK
jgi:hypothetical protein